MNCRLALAAALTLSTCAEPLAAPTLSSRRLRVDGERLRDELGRQVLPRGFNAGGRAKMPPFLPFDDDGRALDVQAADYFARLAGLGANLVRLTFSWEALSPARGEYDEAYLAQYRTLLDAAHAAGLFVIVDFHQDVFASPFCGDGFPLWALGDIPHGPPRYDCGFPDWSYPALNPTSDVSRAFDRLWNNTDGLQDDLEAMWRHVAAAYATHPAVAGFEVINEPGSGSFDIVTFERDVLPAFYERMGAAIREVAGDVPVFGGGRTGDATGHGNHLRTPELPGYVYAPHFYDVAASLGLQSNPAEVRGRVLATLFPAREWGVPVLLGEFGTQNTYEHKAEHLSYIYDALDEGLAGAALWEASRTSTYWNTEDFSVLTSSGEEQSWAHAVVRAYPRAVAGDLVRFSWNSERFFMEVTNATEGISEVYLPPRVVGTTPEISVSEGVRHAFDAASGVLLLSAPVGAMFTVEVQW